MIIHLFTKNKFVITLASTLFVLSPIMIERAFRHTALASHWLILFSIYLYFKSRKENYKAYLWQFILLNILTITIHPYFFPMVFGIFAANMLELIIYKKKVVKPIGFMLLNMISVLIVGYAIGLFGTVGTGDAFGFGHFSMNINAIINPISCGNIIWSNIIKTFPQILGNYDGFNYIGVGVLMYIIFISIHFLCNLLDKKNLFSKETINSIKNFLLRNIGITVSSIVFVLFAVSNVITFNDRIIAEYNLPKAIMKLCSIFRASSRMFYPVYYLLFLSVIIYIIKKFEVKKQLILILVLLIIQIFDIYPALNLKHVYFNSGEIILDTEFESEEWKYIAENYNGIELLQLSFDYKLAAYAAKNNLTSNAIITNRGEFSDIKEYIDNNVSLIESGKIPDKNKVYVVKDSDFYNELSWNLNKNLIPCDLGEYKIFIPQKNNTSLVKDKNLMKKGSIRAADLTDQNWINGISVGKDRILFKNSEIKLRLLKNASELKSGNSILKIDNIEVHNEWIHVITKDSSQINDFSYPNIIEVIDE